MSKFKKGDKVICIRDENITSVIVNEVYEVVEVTPAENLKLKNSIYIYPSDRFTKLETMEIGKKYISKASKKSGITNIVTCVGYDDDKKEFVVKSTVHHRTKYYTVKGHLRFDNGDTCWTEYKEPVIEHKFLRVSSGNFASTVDSNFKNYHNLKLVFSDGVLTRAEVLK